MSLKTREEIKRDCWDVVKDLSTFNYNNPSTPDEVFRRLITIIDALYDEIEKKDSWHTDAPKEDGMYLVQLKALTGARILNTACLNCGCWVLNQDLIDDGLIIEAWMESPEFYKEI